MKITLKAFKLPKAGNSEQEYEDSYYPIRAPLGDTKSLRIAVADGATDAAFSGAWAKLLVRGYCRRHINVESLAVDLQHPQAVWHRYAHRRPLPWYGEQKVTQGAFATIVGLEIFDERRKWISFAVGDSCVFQTRADEITSRFPIESAEEFDNRPALVASVAAQNCCMPDFVKTVEGVWEPGDTFYLMSDALAAWFLRYSKLREANPVEYLRGLSSQAEFDRIVATERGECNGDGEPMMRNDDVTLVSCTVK